MGLALWTGRGGAPYWGQRAVLSWPCLPWSSIQAGGWPGPRSIRRWCWGRSVRIGYWACGAAGCVLSDSGRHERQGVIITIVRRAFNAVLAQDSSYRVSGLRYFVQGMSGLLRGSVCEA